MRTNQFDAAKLAKFHESVQFTGYGYGFGVRTNINPEQAGSLSSVGEFGWDGAKLSYLLCDPSRELSVFHAEHMGGLHSIVEPRFVNLIYSCLDYD